MRAKAWMCMALIGWYVATAAGNGVTIPIDLSVPSTGLVSLALIDAEGVMVRNLLYAQPVAAGNARFFWDGTTDMGVPVPPGTYRTRGVFFTNAPSLEYVMKVGTSGNPPWRLRDQTGDWGGDLGGPAGICANSNSILMLWSAVENNDLSGIQRMDTNGNILERYVSFYPYDGRHVAAMDETNWFLGLSNPYARRLELAVYSLEQTNGRILAHLPTPPHVALSGRFEGRWQTWFSGLAVSSNRIFATAALDDTLYILERASGAITNQVALPSPRGIAIHNGRLFVVSSNEVVRLHLDGSLDAVVVPAGMLESPNAIALDPDGNIYVGDSGALRHDPEAEAGTKQIHVFSPDGSLLRKIGRAGGAPRSGLFDSAGLGEIRGLCVGPDGKLWVQDEPTGFKRTSRWTTDGVLEREWFQRKLTHFTDRINPARPNELLYVANAFDDYPALTAFHFDWTNRTWRPAWSYAQRYSEMYQEDAYISHAHSNPLQALQPGRRHPVFHFNANEFVTFTNGRNYFINGNGGGDGCVFMYSPAHAPRPVALVGYHRVEVITNKVVGYYDTGPNNWFTWADADGNGRMEISEMTFTSELPALAPSGRIFEAALSSNLSVRLLRPVNGRIMESILPLKEMRPDGVPVYDWAMVQDLPARVLPDLNGGAGGKPVRAVQERWVPLYTTNGNYALLEPGTSAPLALPSIDHFWANRNWRKKIARFDDSGRCLWAVGRRAPHRARAGEMYNPFGITYAQDTLFAADVLGVVWVWSSDGLYLGRLYNDTNPGKVWDEYAVQVEVQGPMTLFTDEAAQRLYGVINDTGALVHEVKLPALHKLPEMAIHVTAEQLAGVRPWDPDHGVPVAGSVLKTTVAGGSVTVSWHTNALGMNLQSAGSVTGTWTTVTAPKSIDGNSVRVSLPAGEAPAFYRLQLP
jgi:hypothetical protein